MSSLRKELSGIYRLDIYIASKDTSSKRIIKPSYI